MEELLLEYYEQTLLNDEDEMKKMEAKNLLDTEEEYEAWLKEEMGEAYQTQEEMAEAMENVKKKE